MESQLTKVLFCFPGQGSQRAGMLDNLPNSNFYNNEALRVLGIGLKELNSELNQQQNNIVQAALLIDGVAHASESNMGLNPPLSVASRLELTLQPL